MKKKNKSLALLLLLLIIVISGFFLLRPQRYSTEIPSGFQLQDSTIIDPGKMVLKIWDYSIVDSDIVNVIFNGKPVFKNLLLSDTPVVYNAGFLEKGRYWIGIEGINTGWVGTASPHLSLSNGKQNFEFNIDAEAGKGAYRMVIVK